MRFFPILLIFILGFVNSPALPASKDESAADWIPFIPKAVKYWRDELADKGLAFSATYVGDTIGNLSGGIKRGTIYEGRLDLAVDADLAKLVGWSNTTVHADVFQSHGKGLTSNYVGNIATISEIEALPTTRLYELWIERSLLDDAIQVRIGQQAADVEFFDSETDDLFINSTFGWPVIKSSNLPAGGPSPPLAALGVRVKAKLSERVTAFAAIFDGDSAGPGPLDQDPQLRNRYGLNFRVKDPPWIIGQVRYDYDLEFWHRTLPGNITPGAWLHAGQFDDQRFTANGLSRADPAGSNLPRKLRGDTGVFAVVEQTLYRPDSVKYKGVSNSEPGITMFARAAYSPPDRNIIDFYADAGFGVVGLVPNRPKDRFGAAIAYMHISPAAQQLDRDTQLFTGLASPIRSAETLVEIIYEAHLKPGWLLAPYFQYVFRPSGGVANPTDPSGLSRIGNAAVFGLTTTLKY
jgi:porin